MEKKEQDLALLSKVHRHNLAYLILARDLIKHDVDQAILQLGIDTDIATRLLALPIAQLVELAHMSQLLCVFALQDPALLESDPTQRRLAEAHSARRMLSLLDPITCASPRHSK